MNDDEPQLALREWRMQLAQRETWLALGGVGAVLGVMGPFGTDGLLSLVARLAYWLFLVVTCYSGGAFCSIVVGRIMADRPLFLRVPVAGLATGLFVSVLVVGLNFVVFGWHPEGTEWLPFLGTIFAVTLIVTAVLDLITAQTTQRAAPDAQITSSPQTPPLMDRLPLDKRGGLIALSVEDHYVRIQTTRGTEMILMRLSDAIREVGSTNGAQVHRSHWVAFDQVTAAKRIGDRAVLTLTNDSELPVSRANIPIIKEAGLLPR